MVKFPDVYLLHIGLSKLPASQTNQMKSDPLKRRSLFSGSLREDYIVINQAIVDVYFTPRYLWGYFYTVCPRSSYPFCIVTYYKKWVTTSRTYSMALPIYLLHSTEIYYHAPYEYADFIG